MVDPSPQQAPTAPAAVQDAAEKTGVAQQDADGPKPTSGSPAAGSAPAGNETAAAKPENRPAAPKTVDLSEKAAAAAKGDKKPPQAAKTADTPDKNPAAKNDKKTPQSAKTADSSDSDPANKGKNGTAKNGTEQATSGEPPAVTAAPQTVSVLPSPGSTELLRHARWQRVRRLIIRATLLVLVPTLLSALYFGLVASDEYESTVTFMVQAEEPPATNAASEAVTDSPGSSSSSSRSGLALRGSHTAKSGTSAVPNQAVLAYMTSRDLVARVDKKHHLFEHYRQPKVDWISRLSPRATQEASYQYLRGKLAVDTDEASSLVTLRLKAYDGRIAHQLTKGILTELERSISTWTKRQRRFRVDAARVSVEHASQNLSTLQRQLNALTNAEEATTGNAVGVKPRPTSAKPGHSASGNGESAVSSLRQQVLRAELASSQAQYELAYSELLLSRPTHRIVVITGPSLPDAPSYPQRGRSILTTFLLCLLTMGTLQLIIAAIREHVQV